MDYLKKMFHEFLNEDGEVDVAGYQFPRDKILRELEEQGYTDSFDDWHNRRIEDNLALAESILDKFDNGPRFKKLQVIYRSGALIPFVGAGLSMPSGYPGWTNFLYKVLAESRVDKANFDDLINSGLYEEAAQVLFDDLPRGFFLEQVENAFGLEQEIFGPVQRLPYLFKNAVITTNFDSVILKCYANANANFDEVLLGADAKELPRVLGENRRVLVKLHGKADSSRNRVLTKTEYEAHYSETGSLENVIESISNRTLLFIGCSLNVDRTIGCLSKIVQRRGFEEVPRHYAFLKLNNECDRLAIRDELSKANIYPIWYTGDHDESIEALFEKLAEE